MSAVAFQPPGVPASGIAGRVIDLATGEAIRGARVTLHQIPIVVGIRPSGRNLEDSFYDASQMPATRATKGPPTVLVTDEEGGFRGGFAPGRYQIWAELEGYQVAPAGLTALSLLPGEQLKGVVLKMNRLSSLRGRVLDAEGRPVAQVMVQCLRWSRWGNQAKRMLSPLQQTMTNEGGEYRCDGLAPGQYVIAVDRPPLPTMFAPGVADPARARTFDVISSAPLPSVDVRLEAPPLVTVSGKAAAGARLTLVPREPGWRFAVTRPPTALANADGSFVLKEVPAGSYLLRAALQDSSGALAIKVTAAVEGVSVPLSPAITLRGKVKNEGLRFTLIFEPPPDALGGGRSVQVDPSGRFTVPQLAREWYRLTASGLPSGYYLNPNFVDLREAQESELVLTLEEGTAEVSGKVLDAEQRPLGDVQVLAVSEQGDTVRGTVSLIDGQYRIPDLPPGDYRILPVVDVDITNPQVFERLFAAGAKITLATDAREVRHLILRQ
ncbi:MAG: carboxypeptidase regulatory-like domain-containing protein [Bryobacteraceae bacterium]|nr:carboxypeptidase regulatory-like domain-containing protein [Bryobacteraceae bacterium]